ncbi:MAG: hypothetical protein CL666_04405 [Balneola sp.]|nr:hypothetical protein [Balneola sp.]|tara:strand:+ start:47305 stop:49797 length:2493 start_codon:yes stop_codon:yes gene_type:complete
MKNVLDFLKPVLKFNYSHPYWVVTISLLIAILGGYYALQLKVDTDIASLLPEDNPNVIALEKLSETVGGETEMQVVISSPSFEANKQFAEDLIDRSLELYYPRYEDNFFKRAEFRRETEVVQNNALYLASDKELEEVKDWLQAEIQQAKEEANPFYFDLDEEEEEEVSTDNFEESYNTLVPSEYPINEDSTIMVIKLFPTGSKSDIRYLEDMFEAYDELLASMEPANYHPEMEVRFGGRLQRHLEEFTSIMNDVLGSFATGISSVILLVMLYFFFKKYLHYRHGTRGQGKYTLWSHILRMPVPVLIIGVPLIVSLAWTFGITYFYLGVLNTMTSVLFVILFGLGIDYGIHFYARYIELRSSGMSVYDAMVKTNEKTGEAIVVSAFTTAAALYILMFADFRGFSEFGFIAGTGILLALFGMLYLLPALLVIFDERLNLILISEKQKEEYTGYHRYPFARTIVTVGLVLAVIVVGFSGNLKFQYNFSELEPKFPKYEEFQSYAGQVDDGTKRNPAYIVAETNEQVEEIAAILKERARTDTTSPTIESVETLQERYPNDEQEEQEKLAKIEEIRELLKDPFLVDQESEDLDKLRKASQTTEPLELSEIPDYLKSRFVTKDGEIGRFVIVYPSVGLSDGRKSIAFKDDVSVVQLDSGTKLYAASTSLVAASMLDLMRTESPYMVAATFIFIYFFMLFSFRSFRWSIIAMLPLLVGLLWLFGIMMIFGLQFNFYNLVVLPAILGIGEDSGVHLAHRYREEGKRSMWQVLSSTGQHITMGSITTMLGFAGLLFTSHPGLQSIGIMAVLGIGMTLLTSVTFLPALIQWLEDKDWIRF